DREPKAGATVFPRCGCVRLSEWLKDFSRLIRSHAYTGVLDMKGDPWTRGQVFPRCTEFDVSVARELAGVAYQIKKGLSHLGGIRLHPAEGRIDSNRQIIPVISRYRMHCRHHVVQ